MTGTVRDRVVLRRAFSDALAGAGRAGVLGDLWIGRKSMSTPSRSLPRAVAGVLATAASNLAVDLMRAHRKWEPTGSAIYIAGLSIISTSFCAAVPLHNLQQVSLPHREAEKLPLAFAACAVALLAAGLLLLHWRAYVRIQRRVRILTESTRGFVTPGFVEPLAISWSSLFSKVPGLIQWLVDPARQIEPAEQAAELMASAIQQSKRQIREREAGNLSSIFSLCHDLGARLAKARSAIEALRSSAQLFASEQRQALESAHSEVEQMTALVASVSDFTRTDRDMVDRPFENTSLRRLFEHAVAVFEFDAGRRNIEFDLRIVAGVGEVRLHRALLRRALENLISNALRVTPQGGLIPLRAERSGNTVSIRVSDTGPGIPSDEINRIFDYQFRGEPEVRPGRHATSGLGLALVRNVAALHDGDLSVRNLEPQGAEFTISLPLAGPLSPSF